MTLRQAEVEGWGDGDDDEEEELDGAAPSSTLAISSP